MKTIQNFQEARIWNINKMNNDLLILRLSEYFSWNSKLNSQKYGLFFLENVNCKINVKYKGNVIILTF